MEITFENWLNSTLQGIKIRDLLYQTWKANGRRFSPEKAIQDNILSRDQLFQHAYLHGIMDLFALLEIGSFPDDDGCKPSPPRIGEMMRQLMEEWNLREMVDEIFE